MSWRYAKCLCMHACVRQLWAALCASLNSCRCAPPAFCSLHTRFLSHVHTGSRGKDRVEQEVEQEQTSEAGSVDEASHHDVASTHSSNRWNSSVASKQFQGESQDDYHLVNGSCFGNGEQLDSELLFPLAWTSRWQHQELFTEITRDDDSPASRGPSPVPRNEFLKWAHAYRIPAQEQDEDVLFTNAPQLPQTPRNPAAAGAPAPDIEQVDDEYANMDECDLCRAIVEPKSLRRSMFSFLDATCIGSQLPTHIVNVYATRTHVRKKTLKNENVHFCTKHSDKLIWSMSSCGFTLQTVCSSRAAYCLECECGTSFCTYHIYTHEYTSTICL